MSSDDKPDERATCRWCRRVLIGRNYCFGGRASVPKPDGRYSHDAKVNFYGGFVCSRECDYRAAVELEGSMPGHAGQQGLSPNSPAARSIESNWGQS